MMRYAQNNPPGSMPPLTVTELSSDHDRLQWDQYVLAHPQATGYHLVAWRHIVNEVFGHPCPYLMARDHGGELRGVLPTVLLSSRLFGRFFASLPFLNYGGMLADDEDTATLLLGEISKRAIDRSASHVELRHQGAGSIQWPSTQRKVSMRLDLPKAFDALWKGFPSKLRSQVRRAQKEGMAVAIGGEEQLDTFYDVFSRCMRDLGTPVYRKNFFGTILQTFPKESRICTVSLNGAPIAAGLLYGFRRMVEIPWAGADKRYNRLSPNMLLYNSVLEYACQEGFQIFDFGRSTVDSGTYRFKQQWGAQPHPLVWYYWLAEGKKLPELNPDNPKYQAAIALWQCLPLPVANLIGPHIVKYLP